MITLAAVSCLCGWRDRTPNRVDNHLNCICRLLSLTARLSAIPTSARSAARLSQFRSG